MNCRFCNRSGGVMARTCLGMEHLGPCKSYGLSPFNRAVWQDQGDILAARNKDIDVSVHLTNIPAFDMILTRIHLL